MLLILYIKIRRYFFNIRIARYSSNLSNHFSFTRWPDKQVSIPVILTAELSHGIFSEAVIRSRFSDRARTFTFRPLFARFKEEGSKSGLYRSLPLLPPPLSLSLSLGAFYHHDEAPMHLFTGRRNARSIVISLTKRKTVWLCRFSAWREK